MKKNLITILAILILPILAYMLLTNNSISVADVNQATANKPQIIKFTSTMCLDCQKMNKIFKEIYPPYKDKIVLTEIYVQDGKSFTNSQIEKYNVTLVPTIILINSKGQQVRRIEGAISKKECEQYLKGLK